MKITKEYKDGILEATDLVELVRERIDLFSEGASFKAFCPFHEENTPSFDVSPERQSYKCYGCGEQGDAIGFVRQLDGLGYWEAVEYLAQRAEALREDGKLVGGSSIPLVGAPARVAGDSNDIRSIEWPGELSVGSKVQWTQFAAARGYSPTVVEVLAKVGLLQFTAIRGIECFVVTDRGGRAAEIRRLNGGLFFNGQKQFPLRGVDKSWLIGGAHLDDHSGVLITEGVTDLMTALDLYFRLGEDGCRRPWWPMALLGAACKRIDPGLLERIKGRHVRLVPDADAAGDRMKETLGRIFHEAGCTVDVVELPRGRDLTDERNNLNPEQLFV